MNNSQAFDAFSGYRIPWPVAARNLQVLDETHPAIINTTQDIRFLWSICKKYPSAIFLIEFNATYNAISKISMVNRKFGSYSSVYVCYSISELVNAERLRSLQWLYDQMLLSNKSELSTGTKSLGQLLKEKIAEPDATTYNQEKNQLFSSLYLGKALPDYQAKAISKTFSEVPSTTTRSNSNMNYANTHIDVNSLKMLADTSIIKEFPEFRMSSTDLQAAIKEEQAAARKNAAAAAAKNIMALVGRANGVIQENVLEIRSLRKREVTYKEHIKKVERAIAYGSETENFVPLANLLGICGSSDLSVIPSDWTPKQQEEAATQAAAT